MKVKDLIRILSKANQESDVNIISSDGLIEDISRISSLDTSFVKFLALMPAGIDVMAPNTLKKKMPMEYDA